ncbi:hypothetical protein QDY64_22085 [Klebsiella quasipneumoniae]|uniref:hypothetical protein n=1 Tax=Klebsiella quasipneumoniae TaxID=1463165 RepID=UPI0024477908|nr:hypothetical protein [Klebsiella quasipneumoniae]MDH2712067.1 hypothetical protein [Klebsiella quasipneumoniae]
MNASIADALKSLKSIFFVETTEEDNVNDTLPFQLKNKADSRLVRIDDSPFIFISIKNEDVFAANNFLLMKRLVASSVYPIVLVSSHLSRDFRKMLRSLSIGWVIPEEQSFIPSLFIYNASNEIKEKKPTVDTEKQFGLIPSYIIAHYLSGTLSNTFTSSDIMNLFGVSKMAASRTINDLNNQGVVKELVGGKSRVLKFSYSPKYFWRHYRHRLSSLSTGFLPISLYYIGKLDLFLSGESALASYTLLSPPTIEHLGICMTMRDRYLRPITPATLDGDYLFNAMGILDDDIFENLDSKNYKMVQIFPYKPAIKNGVVDKVFLTLSRFNKNDLRSRSSFFELETEVFNQLTDW